MLIDERLWVAEMGTSVLFVITGLLAVGEFLLFGALAEAYRDIRQLREQTGAIDQPLPVELGSARDEPPSSFGLPPELDGAVRAVVVYVDSRCGTCRTIVSSLNGGIPNGVWLNVIADSSDEAFAWLGEEGFEEGRGAANRVIVASVGHVEQHLGVRVTPLAIEIENGRLARARTIPSVRQFYSMVPTTLTLAPALHEGSLHDQQQFTPHRLRPGPSRGGQ